MANKTKRNKKYVPRKVYYPGVIIQMHSFSEFEKALDNFLEKEEVEVDSEDTFIYTNSAGIKQSFEMTLHIYTLLAYIYGIRHNVEYDLQPLAILQNRMYERRGFDEEEINAARRCLDVCKQIFNKANPLEIRDIIFSIKASLAVEAATEADVKNPEVMLAKMIVKFGNIGYDLVVERSNEYQELAKEFPDDVRVCRIRDEYAKFLAAYRFKRIEEIRNKGL
jgi:hypothetical protein